jgi:hypothetical protein
MRHTANAAAASKACIVLEPPKVCSLRLATVRLNKSLPGLGHLLVHGKNTRVGT